MMRSVTGRAKALAMSGLVLGLVASMELSWTLSGLLFETKAVDPVDIGAAAVLLSSPLFL